MSNLNYYNFIYDKDVLKFQYLPYLYNINQEYIDEFNKNILKIKFGYYEIEENQNNYNIDQKRYFDNRDIKKQYDTRYSKNIKLYKNLTLELSNMINYYKSNNDFESEKIYEGYLYKIQNQISSENVRIKKIIDKLKNNKKKILKKSFDFNTLIILTFILFSIFIFVYNFNF
tara:strand:+ start:464 stop:979 length:516 start_codon:yes stop_codon:yes gene_type:complete